MVFREEIAGLVDEAEKLAATLEAAAARVGDKHPDVARRFRVRSAEADEFVATMRPWLKTELAASYLIA